MEKVYIVTTGDYDDYHISKCFKTRKDAKNYIALYDEKGQKNFSIEVRPIENQEIGYKGFFLRMSDKFEVIEIYILENDYGSIDLIQKDRWGNNYTCIIAKNEEEAISIGKELVKKSLAI